jgi:hypothetical protein
MVEVGIWKGPRVVPSVRWNVILSPATQIFWTPTPAGATNSSMRPLRNVKFPSTSFEVRGEPFSERKTNAMA